MSDQPRDRTDDTHLPDDAPEEVRRQAGDRLRERIYVTFTALAILMAMNSHGEHLDSPTVLWTLVISVVGVILAGLASDLVSHMVVHNTLPSVREFRHMVAVSSRALGVLVVPLIAIGLAVFDVIEARTGLIIAIVALIASLAVIARIAVARTGLSGWRQFAVLGVLVALGAFVVFLEALVH
jgi:hypothetical protein